MAQRLNCYNINNMQPCISSTYSMPLEQQSNLNIIHKDTKQGPAGKLICRFLRQTTRFPGIGNITRKSHNG
jgi:hypothetical protein